MTWLNGFWFHFGLILDYELDLDLCLILLSHLISACFWIWLCLIFCFSPLWFEHWLQSPTQLCLVLICIISQKMHQPSFLLVNLPAYRNYSKEHDDMPFSRSLKDEATTSEELQASLASVKVVVCNSTKRATELPKTLFHFPAIILPDHVADIAMPNPAHFRT